MIISKFKNDKDQPPLHGMEISHILLGYYHQNNNQQERSHSNLFIFTILPPPKLMRPISVKNKIIKLRLFFKTENEKKKNFMNI